jgi:hypothetical protein
MRINSVGPCRRTHPADSPPDLRCLRSCTHKAGVARTSSGFRMPRSFTSAVCAAKHLPLATILIGILKGVIWRRILHRRPVFDRVPLTGATSSCRCRRATTRPWKTSRTTGRGADITRPGLPLPPKQSTIGSNGRTTSRAAMATCFIRKRGAIPLSKAASRRTAPSPYDWSSTCAVRCRVTTVSIASSRSIPGLMPAGTTDCVISHSNGRPGTRSIINGECWAQSFLCYLSVCTRRAQSCTGFGSDGSGNKETPSQRCRVVEPAPFESPQHDRLARPMILRSDSRAGHGTETYGRGDPFFSV